MSKKFKRDDYYNQTQLKELGFNIKMIKTLLPEPLLKTNPFYASAPPMKLWEIEVVNEVIDSDEFADMLEASMKRKKSAAKAVKTKQEKLHKEVEKKIAKIKVKKFPLEDIKKRTIEDKNDWYFYQAMIRMTEIHSVSASDIDVQTLNRWMVNYIRHNITDYDKSVYEMSGKVGCQVEYLNYRDAVLDKIAESYPELKEECETQKDRKKMMIELLASFKSSYNSTTSTDNMEENANE